MGNTLLQLHGIVTLYIHNTFECYAAVEHLQNVHQDYVCMQSTRRSKALVPSVLKPGTVCHVCIFPICTYIGLETILSIRCVGLWCAVFPQLT